MADFDILTRYWDVPEALRGLSVALGNFDGLHVGHLAVIEAAKAHDARASTGWALVTFEPPPAVWFGRAGEHFRLTLPEQRAGLAASLGARAVFELPFGEAIAAMTDAAFVETVLHQGLGARHVAIGADFRFGRERMGSSESLRHHAAGLGLAVSVVSPVLQGGGADAAANGVEKVSSSDIRTALVGGDVERAARLLGRVWTAAGRVEHGEKRGRTIGYPTANIRLGDMVEPRHGIYAVLVRIEGEDNWRPGVANFGRTPTTGERDPLMEAFIFDWSGDIYGRFIEIALIAFLRDEARFDSLDALVAQMDTDTLQARTILEALPENVQLPPLPRLHFR